jgi:hypothetical protein
MCTAHDTEGRSTDGGVRSEFKAVDAALSAAVWPRLAPHLPPDLDGGHVLGLRTEWHNAR